MNAPWPDPPSDAVYHGLAGHFVKTFDPFTEADPIAVLVGFLTAFGCAVGPGPYAMVSATRHTPRLFIGCAGRTSSGRKSDSIQATREVFKKAAADMRQRNGLSTGEGLIYQVRNRKTGLDKKGDEVVLDAGVADKRLLLIETEGGRVFRVMHRDGNTLAPILQDAWDGVDLAVMTRTNDLEPVSGAHVSLILFIPTDQLTRVLTAEEGESGFANRFLWVLARRSKEIPSPKPFTGDPFNDLALRVSEALGKAQAIGFMQRDRTAEAIWSALYSEIGRERPAGLSADILHRAAPQVLRISMIYALLDGTADIGLPHLRAALALWEYVERCVISIFGDALGHPEADTILKALRREGQLDRTQIRDLFSRNVSAGRLEEALALLRTEAKATPETVATGGRPREIWTATPATATLSSYVVAPEGQNEEPNGSENYDIYDQSIAYRDFGFVLGNDENDERGESPPEEDPAAYMDSLVAVPNGHLP